jgi:flotillin
VDQGLLLPVLGGLLVATILLFGIIAINLRRVVPTNEVHIVQSAKATTSYGNGTGHGNTYYEWPTWLPVIGVSKSVLPLNNFKLVLEDYESLDSGRLPFVIDIQAFFRIIDFNKAAARMRSFTELNDQLTAIVKGAARVVLAASDIEEILSGRATLGKRFTDEVDDKLSEQFGIAVVGHIELMDIRDTGESKVIHQIMDKKKSHIEMESRTEVAKNKKVAAMAEIEAQKEVDIQAQSAKQEVGLRTTQNERQVALAQQEKIQAVKEQEKLTKEKEMAVNEVQNVRTAEITRKVNVVQAQEYQQTATLAAETKKTTLLLEAEGALEAKRREAEGIALEGKAKADAQRSMLLAPVEAQTTLAKEIGSNESYQKYLVTVEQIKANQAVGTAQADALKAANIKVIANSGNVSNGINSITDILSSKGGTEMGAMLEGFANTDMGQRLMSQWVKKEDDPVVVSTTTTKATTTNGSGKGYTNGSAKA